MTTKTSSKPKSKEESNGRGDITANEGNPEEFSVEPIYGRNPHEDKPDLLLGYVLKRTLEDGDLYAGTSMSWVRLRRQVNGIFRTHEEAEVMIRWQIEQEARLRAAVGDRKEVLLVRTDLFYCNAGDEYQRAVKINLQLTEEETIALLNVRRAAQQMGTVTDIGKPVVSYADVVRLIFQAIFKQMS